MLWSVELSSLLSTETKCKHIKKPWQRVSITKRRQKSMTSFRLCCSGRLETTNVSDTDRLIVSYMHTNNQLDNKAYVNWWQDDTHLDKMHTNNQRQIVWNVNMIVIRETNHQYGRPLVYVNLLYAWVYGTTHIETFRRQISRYPMIPKRNFMHFLSKTSSKSH